MSADKYPCIFSRQMATIVYIAVVLFGTLFRLTEVQSRLTRTQKLIFQLATYGSHSIASFLFYR